MKYFSNEYCYPFEKKIAHFSEIKILIISNLSFGELGNHNVECLPKEYFNRPIEAAYKILNQYKCRV